MLRFNFSILALLVFIAIFAVMLARLRSYLEETKVARPVEFFTLTPEDPEELNADFAKWVHTQGFKKASPPTTFTLPYSSRPSYWYVKNHNWRMRVYVVFQKEFQELDERWLTQVYAVCEYNGLVDDHFAEQERDNAQNMLRQWFDMHDQ